VARAVQEPPATGRAFVRGMEIRRLHRRHTAYCCDWSGVWDRRQRRVLDLSDPFTTQARWVTCRDDPVLPAPAMDPVRAWHAQAMALYREAHYEAALRLFLRAARVHPDRAHASAVANARFWAATVLHNMGRLRDAGVLLDELAAMPPSDDLLYMALT